MPRVNDRRSKSWCRRLSQCRVNVIILWLLAVTPTGAVFAQTSVPPESGSGSTEDPYQIATLNNLYWLSQTRTVWDQHFQLTANIDARSTETWDDDKGFSPIGICEGVFESEEAAIPDCSKSVVLESTPFTGTFDGQSFTITGLTINRPKSHDVGLFGEASGPGVLIRNLRLERVNITGYANVGGVVGELRGGRLENVSVTGNIVALSDRAGGLMGIGSFATATDRNVFLGTVSARNEAGGLVGRAKGNTSVSLSYARGDIIETDGTLQFCQGAGESNCGGAGGLVGNTGTTSTFSNMYFAGTVTSPVEGNAIAGDYNSSDDFRNVYWDAEVLTGDTAVPGSPTAPGGIRSQTNLVGLTTAQMQGENARTNMHFDDFDASWQVITSPQAGYPVFNWQSGNVVTVVSGTLRDQNNQPLGAGITVSAIPNSAFFDTEETVTDANGEYAFTDVIFDAPDYILAASTIVNSRTLSANAFFDPSTTSTLNLTLTPNVEVAGISAENTGGTTIAITVTATEPLSGLLVAVTGPSASNLFLENGFDETANGDGTFSYSRNYEATEDGGFTFTVEEAIGLNGANGAQDESTTVGINRFVVTTVALNGRITSPRNPGLNLDETTTVTGEADNGYFFSAVSGCGGEPQSNTDQDITDFSYTTGMVDADCTVTATFSFRIDGAGTTDNPYQVTSWAQLDSVRNDLDADYRLMNTLDSSASGYTAYNTDDGWTPIGSPANPFSGSFNGDGFAINDLLVAGSHPAYGLFGATGASANLAALTLGNVSISPGDSGQAGPAGALVGVNEGRISNAAVNGGSVDGTANAAVGGLVGLTTSTGMITDSRSSGGVSVAGGAPQPGILYGSNEGSELIRSHAEAIALTVTVQPVAGLTGTLLTTQPAVAAVDSHGLRDLTYDGGPTVSAAVGSGDDGLLTGTTAIGFEEGLAAYPDLSFSGTAGMDYTLLFSSTELGNVASQAFQVVMPPPPPPPPTPPPEDDGRDEGEGDDAPDDILREAQASGARLTTRPEESDSSCTIDRFVAQPTTTTNRPEGIAATQEFDFTLTDCLPGESVDITIDFGETLPVNGQVYKVVEGEWTLVTGATVSGTAVSYTVTDNGPLDINPADGIIRDPVTVIAPPAQAIPLWSVWMAALTAMMLGLLGVWHQRSTCAMGSKSADGYSGPY